MKSQTISIKKHNQGFIGLLSLLIVVAIIAVAIILMKKTWFADFGEGKAGAGTGFNAIDSAQNAKNLIEENSRKTDEQLK